MSGATTVRLTAAEQLAVQARKALVVLAVLVGGVVLLTAGVFWRQALGQAAVATYDSIVVAIEWATQVVRGPKVLMALGVAVLLLLVVTVQLGLTMAKGQVPRWTKAYWMVFWFVAGLMAISAVELFFALSHQEGSLFGGTVSLAVVVTLLMAVAARDGFRCITGRGLRIALSCVAVNCAAFSLALVTTDSSAYGLAFAAALVFVLLTMGMMIVEEQMACTQERLEFLQQVRANLVGKEATTLRSWSYRDRPIPAGTVVDVVALDEANQVLTCKLKDGSELLFAEHTWEYLVPKNPEV